MNGMWLLLLSVLLSGLYHVTHTRTIPAFVMVDEVALDNKLTPKHAHNEPSIFNGISGKSAKNHESILNSHNSKQLTFQENTEFKGSGVNNKATFHFFPPDRVNPSKDIKSHHGRKISHGPVIKVTPENDMHYALDKVYKKGKTHLDYNDKYKATITSKIGKTYPSEALQRLKENVLITVPTPEMSTPAVSSGSTEIPTVHHVIGTAPMQTTEHSNIELSSSQTTSDPSFPITTTGDGSPGHDPSVDTTVFSTKEQLLPESTTVSTRDMVTLSKVNYTTKTTEPSTSTTEGTQISIPDVSEVNTNLTQPDTSSTSNTITTAVFDMPSDVHLGMGSSTESSTENGHVLKDVTSEVVTLSSSSDINSEFQTTTMENRMSDGNNTITGDAVEGFTPETGYSDTTEVHNTALSQVPVSSPEEGADFRENLVDSVVAAKINKAMALDNQMEGVKALFSAADPRIVNNLSTTQDPKTPTLLTILSKAMSTITSQQSNDGQLVASDFSWYLSPGNRVRSRSVIDQNVAAQQDTTANATTTTTTTSTNATNAPDTTNPTTTTQTATTTPSTTTTSTTTTTTVPTTTTTTATTTSTTTTVAPIPDYCYLLCQIGQCPPSCKGRVGGWSR